MFWTLVQVLKRLSAIQGEEKVLFVVGKAQFARVGQDDHGVVESLGEIVNHEVVEHTRVAVFFFYQQVVAAYLVVEDTLGYVQFGRLLPYREEQGIHLHLGLGQYVVLEKEGTYGNENDGDDERVHGLPQGDAGRLDGQEFEPLAQVAECHERRQEHRQGQRHGHDGEGGVEKQLGQDAHFDAFAYQFIDIFPQKLHQQHKEADEECHQK